MAEFKKCPMCAEQITTDAVFCPYCGTHFGEEVQAAPPPAAPHATVSPSAAPANVQPAAPAPLPTKKSHAGLWIAGIFVLVIIVVAIATLLWTKRANIPAPPDLSATSTPAAAITPPPTFTPTTVATRTPRPTATSTPLPAWVTDFAQPILDAIANRSPNFQDNFGPGSGGWQAPDWCGRRMDYVDEKLVVTDCRVSRSNINYPDFVIEFDAQLLPGAASDSHWVFDFRDVGGPNHSVRIDYSGDVLLEFYKGGFYDFPKTAKPGNQTNHILVIGKDSKIAVFLNDEPLFFTEVPQPQSGDFRFFADGTVLAIDNLKIWNIDEISVP